MSLGIDMSSAIASLLDMFGVCGFYIPRYDNITQWTMRTKEAILV